MASADDRAGDPGGTALARALRDAGFEVVYAGVQSSPDVVAEVVLQEDAEAVVLALDADETSSATPIEGALVRRGLAAVAVVAGPTSESGSRAAVLDTLRSELVQRATT